MQHRLPPNYLSSQSNENSKVEKNVFSKCAQSLAITAASLQLLSAGHVSALPSTLDEVAQSAITKSIEISDMVAKFPEAASFLKDVDFAAKSSEILNNIQQYPLVPSGSKLLTTTVRPDDKDSESREAQLKRIQWWKNTGFSLEKVNMDVQSKLKSLPDEISSLDIKSLPKDVRFWGGIAGVFFIADIFQQSNQLNKMVDDLRLKLTDREAKLNSSNTMNRDTINLLKTDYLKVIDEVDSLIKQLDDKASHITVLNETLQSLTLTVNTTDTNSKQMLTQYSRQLVSADSLIRSLKSQIVELPRKVAREVASDYKNQITMSEKRNDELQMEIARMVKEGAKTNVNVATKDHPPAIAAPAVSQFPTLSRSFPSSIFSPPVSPLVIENEKQAAEISQIKIAIVELENENKREKADKNELEIKLDALKGTLTLTESELSAKKSAENLYFDILNGRLSAMEKQISEFMSENRELKEKLSVAEGELKRLAIREEERMDMEAKRTAEDAKVPLIIHFLSTYCVLFT